MMSLIPLIESRLALLVGRLFFGFSHRHRLDLLVTGCILQNGALNVDFVHEVESVARSLKLVVEACCILFMYELFKLAHTSVLRSLRRTTKEPRFLLEDREIFDL